MKTLNVMALSIVALMSFAPASWASEDDQPKRSVAQFDKPTDYYFDLSREGDKKPTFLKFTAPAKFWSEADSTIIDRERAPSARRGSGRLFTYVDNPDSGFMQGVMYVEVVDTADVPGGEGSKDALDTCISWWVTELAGTLAKGSTKLLSDVEDIVVEETKVRLGRKSTPARSIAYNCLPTYIDSKNAVFRGNALAFLVNDHLVIASTEADRVPAFEAIREATFSVETVGASRKPRSIDLRDQLDASDGKLIGRHVVFELPAGFGDEISPLEDGVFRTWRARAKNGDSAATLTLRSRSASPKADLKLEAKLEADLIEAQRDGVEVSVAGPVEVDARPAFLLTYEAGAPDATSTVYSVVFKIYDRVFQLVLTVPSSGKPAQKLKKDILEKGVLPSLRYWYVLLS